MSRWRETKQGRVKSKKEKPKKIPSYKISPIINRIKAFIIDSFMIFMPLVYFSFYVIAGNREEFSQNLLVGWLWILIPHFIITLSFWYLKGQTPGYKAHNMVLVDNDLKRPSLSKLIIRYFSFALSLIMFAGLLLAFIRKDKKTLHDLLSLTMPIDEK